MKLSVCILTFNQVNFVKQCLDSILMQRVEFKYEIIVGDDGSTDGTKSILLDYQRKYPHIFFLLLNDTNQGISVNYKNVLSRCSGEYVALCEGDDYWTDPLKLQKQVDFLESHMDYGFVGAYNQLLFPDNKFIDDPYQYLPEPIIEDNWELYGNVFDYAKYGPVTRTVSLCFRKSIIDPYMHHIGVGCDLVLQTILAKHSLFAKYKDSMCIYRQGGVSTDKWSIHKKLYYNRWYVENRLLQKKLFPQDCNWKEEELNDIEIYLYLCDSINNFSFVKALKYKQQLTSKLYKCKMFSRYLYGPLTFILLFLTYKIKLKYQCKHHY